MKCQAMKWLRRALALLLVALVAAGAWVFWVLEVAVPTEAEVAAVLTSLGKNRGFADFPARRVPMRFEHGGTEHEVEFVHAHVPRDPARADALPESAPPVVLIHPTPHSLYTWSEVVFGSGGGEGLAGRVDVHLIDVLGHGVTPTTVDAAGADAMSFQLGADWIAAALDALGLKNVCLVGQSYGGEFAWRAALDHPELIGRLVLIDSAGYPRAEGDWLPEEVALREMSLAYYGYPLNTRDKIRHALQVHFAEPVADERVEEVFQVCRLPDKWRAMVDLCRDENGTRSGEIARITQPTLLIWGEDDVAYDLNRYGRRFARDIAGAELVVVEGCGHYPQEERAGRLVEALLAFLQRS